MQITYKICTTKENDFRTSEHSCILFSFVWHRFCVCILELFAPKLLLKKLFPHVQNFTIMEKLPKFLILSIMEGNFKMMATVCLLSILFCVFELV